MAHFLILLVWVILPAALIGALLGKLFGLILFGSAKPKKSSYHFDHKTGRWVYKPKA